jgi:glycogen debranching enzyme
MSAEIPHNPDDSGAIATELQLPPGGELVSVEHTELHHPDKHLSVLKAVMGLTAVTAAREIGENGPSNAANVTDASKDKEALNLYGVFFPRDAHVVARFLAAKFPKLTRATIMESLRFTGVRDNLHSNELKDEQEVGKVPHEIRDPETDPIAARLTAEKDWGWPYYGAVDTTVKNTRAIAETALAGDGKEEEQGIAFLRETYEGIDGREHTVEEALQLHIEWIFKRMSMNPEGLVESIWVNPKHHPNQTWADSPDAFHHADGSLAEHHPEKGWGVASVELQAEVYDTLTSTAAVYEKLAGQAGGERRESLQNSAQGLYEKAAELRKVVLEKFWVEDPEHFGGFFARGTDRDENGNLRPLAVRSSDMGHLLNSGILDGDDPEVVRKREAVIKNLFSDEMLSPSGIRTLSTDSVRYWKDAYHNGTSWPWVTYHIALGLQRYGYYGLAYELKERIWHSYDETKILPEYLSGSDDPGERLITNKVIVRYPNVPGEPVRTLGQPPQEIQAWTAAALLAMKYEEGGRLNARLRPHRKSGKEIPTAATDAVKERFEQSILSQIKT